MGRKRLTKKAKNTTVKVKRQAKMTALTVAETLKQLPKQFKKELTTLKMQARKLSAALNKAKKQQNKASIALTKKSTKGKIVTAARKAYRQISQTMTDLNAQLETVNNSMAFLSQKQAGFIALSKPLAKKPGNKPKKAMSRTKSQKKLLKSPMPVTATDENRKTITPNESAAIIATPEPEVEVEFNS